MQIACPHCEAAYRVAESSIGRKTRCKKCENTFCIAAPDDGYQIRLEGEGAIFDPSAHREALPVDGPADAVAMNLARVDPEIPPATGSTFAPIPAYLAAVAKSGLFPLQFGNLITFVFACGCMALQQFLEFASLGGMMCLLVVALIIVNGWYMSFLFRVAHAASANDDTLPELSSDEGWLEGLVLPLLGSLLSWVVAALPFLVAVIALYSYDQTGGMETAVQCIGFLVTKNALIAFEPDLGGGPMLGCLAIIALLLWPMFLLVTAIGGLPCIARLDLIAVAIARSLPAYLLMSVIATVLMLVPSFLWELVGPEWDPASTERPPIGVFALMGCAVVYFQIVAMRAIGLYYHYFKHRMAWSWG